MEDYKLRSTVDRLENQVDKLYKEVHTLKQIQQELVEQIKKLKGEKNE